MITSYKKSEWETVTEREVVFDDGVFNGFGFPCDEEGKPVEECDPCAMENYYWCLEHPERFVRFNKVIERKRTYKNPPCGICECGEEIYFGGPGYYGAYECPCCGRWYNSMGQELEAPENWEENLEDDY